MSPNRKSIRLPGYDYSQNGAYFVTICTKDRENLFGKIIQGRKFSAPTGEPIVWEPIEFGKIAEQCWYEIPLHYPDVELDTFVVMPNHVHGIICIVGAENFLPSNNDPQNAFQDMIPRSLSAIIRGYKIGVTKGCREINTGIDIWQRNFYEHVIRDENDLIRIREYILNNPAQWSEDEMNQGP